MAPTSPPTFRRRRIGKILVRMRERAQLTQQQVAAELNLTNDRVSRVETGRVKLEVPLLRSLMDVYSVDDLELRAVLEEMVRSVSARGWWQGYASHLHPAFQDFIGLELDAAELRMSQILLVPGPLQTEEYARAVLAAGSSIVHASSAAIDAHVQVRMRRQQELLRPTPLRLTTVLNEAALRTFEDKAILKRQITHLLAASEAPNIDLRLLPLAGAPHLGMPGAFDIFVFADGEQLVSLETLVDPLFLEEQRDVDIYVRTFSQLSERALDQEATRACLDQMGRDL